MDNISHDRETQQRSRLDAASDASTSTVVLPQGLGNINPLEYYWEHKAELDVVSDSKALFLIGLVDELKGATLAELSRFLGFTLEDVELLWSEVANAGFGKVEPSVGSSPRSAALMRLNEDPPSPRQYVADLDVRWEETILRCLARDPTNRFNSAADIVRALRGEEVVTARAHQVSVGSSVRLLKQMWNALSELFPGQAETGIATTNVSNSEIVNAKIAYLETRKDAVRLKYAIHALEYGVDPGLTPEVHSWHQRASWLCLLLAVVLTIPGIAIANWIMGVLGALIFLPSEIIVSAVLGFLIGTNNTVRLRWLVSSVFLLFLLSSGILLSERFVATPSEMLIDGAFLGLEGALLLGASTAAVGYRRLRWSGTLTRQYRNYQHRLDALRLVQTGIGDAQRVPLTGGNPRHNIFAAESSYY